MKSLKRELKYSRHQGRLSGDKSNALKLDRKSSRGMIYENEELRLRTININAEVERGQSDIRKLRRENEQLRREIWSLRDEYDRLNKKFKANKTLPENNGVGSVVQFLRGSSISEDSDSPCDGCCEDDDEYDGRMYSHCDGKRLKHTFRDDTEESDQANSHQEIADNYENAQRRLDGKYYHKDASPEATCSTPSTSSSTAVVQHDSLHVNFDHLSVVSEENLTSSDGNSMLRMDVAEPNGGPLRLDIVQSADAIIGQLSDLQNAVPPLSYFENITVEHLDSGDDDVHHSTTSTATTGETVVAAKEWDFDIQSPFAARKFPPPLIKQKSPSRADPSAFSTNNNNSIVQKSPKHFFSPIKPRLRVDAPLDLPPAFPPMTPPTTPMGPDFFVANALGSPYYAPHTCTAPSPVLAPVEPVYATVQKAKALQRSATPNASQTRSGNLDELLHDIEALSQDILQMQLKKPNSHSMENIASQPADEGKTAPSNSSGSNKPYRSEVNLLLSYNGTMPVIEPLERSASSAAVDEKEVPEPVTMPPALPAYLGFEGYAPEFPSPVYVGYPLPPPDLQPGLAGSSPELMNARSPASIRRKMYSIRTDDSQATQAFDVDDVIRLSAPTSLDTRLEKNSPVAEAAATAKRKSRRVSILFCDKHGGDDSDKEAKSKDSQDAGALSTKANPTILSSPHSERRRSSAASHLHHHHGHHHHGRKMSQESRCSLNHSLMGLPGHLRSKSVRRHSDGTLALLHGGGRNSTAGTGDYAGPRSSYQDVGASLSERNSLASSGESSASFSMRSQRRKISVSSHTGGKIPWCGCWGNGCL